MSARTKKNIEYIGIGLFVLVVGWGTLLTIDTISSYFSAEPLDLATVPETLQLKSEPQDVIYAETKETSDGVGEVKYAYLESEVPPEEKEDVTRRTPVSQTEVLEVKQEGSKKIEKLATTFYAKPQFYEDNGQWRQIEYATTTPEVFAASGAIKYVQKREFWERLLPGKPVFALTSTFYPNPNVETVSVDGEVSYLDLSLSTSANDSATAIDTRSWTTYDGFDCFCYVYNFDRGVFLFDTSSLTAAAEVSASTLSVYVTARSVSDNDGSDTLGVFSSNPASNTALVGSDYDTIGATNYASSPPDISSMSTGVYVGIALNASGIATVANTGITKLALREGHDSGPLINDGASNLVTVSSAEVGGTSQDPKLEVIYTTGSFSMGQWFPF